MLKEFIDHLNWHVDKSIYVWGGQGQELSKLDPTIIDRMENANYNRDNAIAMWKKRKNIPGARAFDCSGLGCYLMEVVGAVPKGFDTTANGLKASCTKVSPSEIRPGYFVFKNDSTGRAYHIGYVVEGNNVVEARGRAYGVVKRPFKDGGWDWCGKPKFFKFDEPVPEPSTWVCSRNLKLTSPQMSGNDVKSLQKALKEKGYTITTLTGKFGTQTKQAVLDFQKDNKLKADGIAGKNTITKLGGKFNG